MRMRFNSTRARAAGAGLLAAGCLLGESAFGQAPDLSPLGRQATAYALTCSYSGEHADPTDWQLLASTDGLAWAVLDVRTNQTFRHRGERQVYSLTNHTAYGIYRLQLNNVAFDVSLAELEIMGPAIGVTNEADLQIAASASNEHPLIGPAEQAFDNDPATQWLAFSSPETKTCWVQCHYVRHANVELTNVSQCVIASRRMATRSPLLEQAPGVLAELKAAETKPIRSLSGYALTAANDSPGRDPRDWRLLGSNDGGKNWQTLDTRRNEEFATRYQRRVFTLTNHTAFATYRLAIDSVRGPADWADWPNCVQLAEIEPVAAGITNDDFGLAILARGDNPPIESAEMAFDGHSKTKWLDFGSTDPTNKSSWVQWQYFRTAGSPVVNIQRLRAACLRPPQPFQLRLTGVVASWQPEKRLLGLLDQTGFLQFEVDAAPPGLEPGRQMRLAGVLHFKEAHPQVSAASIELLDRLPAAPEIRPGQRAGDDAKFTLASVAGKVVSISETAAGLTVGLEDESNANTMQARIIGATAAECPLSLNSRARVEGIVQPEYGGSRQRVYGAIWVPSPDRVTKLAPASTTAGAGAGAKDTGGMEPESTTSIARVSNLLDRQPGQFFRAKLSGVITYIDLTFDYFYLQDGADAIAVGAQLAAGLAPYMGKEGYFVEVEVQSDTNQHIVTASSPVTLLGRGQMPPPLRHTLDYIMSGRDDSKWVQVEGLVIMCEEHRLILSVLGGQLVVWVNELPSGVRAHLVGCGVRVTGICSPLVNTRNRRLGVRLLAPDAECVEIVTRPPADPFTLRTQPIGRLLQSDWRRAAMPTVLAKTAGVVTHKEPLMLILQDGAEGLAVSLDRDLEIAPGDRAEAVGFTEPDGASTKLIHALVRKIGTSPQPEPKAIDILGGDLNEQDATRCKIEATYLGRSTSESMQVLEFQDLQHLRTFSAFFPVSGGLVPAIPVGSRAMLRGVLKTEVDTLPDFGKVLASFRIYANSPDDLHVTAMPSWWDLRRLLWLLAGVSTLTLACVAWASMLRRTVAQRTADLRAEVEQRRRTATSLEQEIVERKRMQAQVEKTHGQLVEASRLAGKAEVASSVLHNVGNVLNSVNVSAALLAAKLKISKAPKVARIADLLEPRQEDLPQFIATDPKGRMLPNYVRELAKYIREEENAASAELDSLVNNVEHIKEIVAMQQSHAKLVAVTELVSPVDLIEDALRFSMASPTRQDLQVVREFAPNLPAIMTDRHKAIQILVNLLRNARQACLEAQRTGMVLTLRAVCAEDRIRITIMDNGVGIAAENLLRIFNFGFTTRPNGHGFGLHSSALAAKEMGGGLTACSDGDGKGAAFTLELPLQPAGPSRPVAGS